MSDDHALGKPLGEYALYRNDRAAWARQVAQRWLQMLRSASNEDGRRHLWRIAGPELRHEITALSKAEPAAR